ncbi:WPP domain-interacting protein 1, putative isoform 1 [Hibiscus syriacus]|uniref:WPP domain-interacting protein 1, putative isoform 1 n=1 Tax=Hibiscus syriacus TaxID=106335 RepID=A0A6A2XLT7_HIBSY|nr:WPP domain-interacting tail-anchored protein 1-like [Hibiscus syriacus]KAE8659349.1 WPP domain-interacting protein 1, putative isoform 1 [Hibiscus syriacus]
MDADIFHEEGVSGDEFNSMEPEAGSSRTDILDETSSGGGVNGELGRASEILIRVDLDFACFSEKLVNISVLTMRVATREVDFESILSDKDNLQVESMEKAVEFELLSGILDSEVTELYKFMEHLETYIISSRESISSFKHLGETFFKMEEKLLDYEESLKQLRDQVSEIKMQAVDFHRIISRLHGNDNGNDEDVNISEAEQYSTDNAKIKMQTIEQQRHILIMLEKSLAREIDLEKKFTESRQIEEELKPRVLSLEQGIVSMEEEAMDVNGRLFEAQNAAVVFMGISQELLGRLQHVQFNLNNSVHRETEMRSKLNEATEKLKAKESALRKLASSDTRLNDFLMAQVDTLKAKLAEVEQKFILADSEAFTMRDKADSLDKQLKESELNLFNANISLDESREQHDILCSQLHTLEDEITDLREKLFEAEKRADNAESKCKLLGEANMELNEELCVLKDQDVTSEKVELLEKLLKESEIRLMSAVASAEASQEKQNMLYSTIGDMENLIEDLKLKVSKAENRADSAEDKCIVLSETNAELSEELRFLRSRLGGLEASLNQAEEMKMATARDIDIRTKLIANLLMQLASERERLHQQISGLAKENKILVVKLKQADKDPVIIESHKENVKDFFFSNQYSTAAFAREAKEEIAKSAASGSEPDKTTESVGESDVRPADSTSDYETVRTIDARLLSFKHISLALLVVLMSTAAAYYFQKQKNPSN